MEEKIFDSIKKLKEDGKISVKKIVAESFESIFIFLEKKDLSLYNSARQLFQVQIDFLETLKDIPANGTNSLSKINNLRNQLVFISNSLENKDSDFDWDLRIDELKKEINLL